jgi:hypothetical protein
VTGFSWLCFEDRPGLGLHPSAGISMAVIRATSGMGPFIADLPFEEENELLIVTPKLATSFDNDAIAPCRAEVDPISRTEQVKL